jgi:hypothetical protein
VRAPKFVQAERILRKHRGRGSYGFLIRWTVWHRRKRGSEDALPESIMHGIGIHDPRLDKIAGIYNGLERELGSIRAAAICIEIVQSVK